MWIALVFTGNILTINDIHVRFLLLKPEAYGVCSVLHVDCHSLWA